MPLMMTDTEYADGLMRTPDRCLIDHARWENMPAGHIFRDIINRFITPKCYLIVPGDIVDGPPLSLIIGEDSAPGYRNAGEVLRAIALFCGYQTHITLDGRIHLSNPQAISVGP